MSAPPEGVERDYPLARLTTVRTGGPADFFARPGDRGGAGRAAALGRGRGARGRSGRLRLEPAGRRRWLPRPRDQARRRARARSSARASALLCGGGARLPSAAAKAAGWGLSGLEFGINIPGTVGGAVRMNANAYGGELGRVLEWVDVCTADGRRAPRARTSSASPTGARTSRAGEVVARASLPAAPGDPDGDQGDAGGDARAPPRGAALGDQDLRLDLQEPRGRARRGARPPASCSRRPAAAGCGVGGARFSEKHANFVENAGEATHRRRAGADGRGPAPGPRALRRRARARGPGAGRGRAGPAAGSCEAPAGGRRAGRRSSAAAVYWFLVRDTHGRADRRRAAPAATLGSGEDAVVVAADGAVVRWLPRARAIRRCRSCRSTSRRRAGSCGARCWNRPGSSARRRRRCGPTSTAATTAKAGSTSSSPRGSNCASATPPRPSRSGGRRLRCSPIRRSPRSIM